MRRRLLSATIRAAITAHSPLSFAQSGDSGDKQDVQTPDRIPVAGSLIPRVQVETATPITSISAQEIQKQGLKDAYEALCPQPLATGTVQDSPFSGGFTPGARPISLPGLDPGFILALFDRRPMADYPLRHTGQRNFVDLVSIPPRWSSASTSHPATSRRSMAPAPSPAWSTSSRRSGWTAPR
jgi:hypothetical protein